MKLLVVAVVALMLAIHSNALSANNNSPKCRGFTLELGAVKAAFNSEVSYDDLFCSGYLNRYKDGVSGTGEGKVCVRGAGAEATSSDWYKLSLTEQQTLIRTGALAADADAHAKWNLFGDKYGYEKVPGVSKNPASRESRDRDVLLWGTGSDAGDDIPTNWCSHHMKAMLCHVAFPQGDTKTYTKEEKLNPTPRDVRPVCMGNCLKLLRNCNRRQPTDEELSSDYRPLTKVHQHVKQTRTKTETRTNPKTDVDYKYEYEVTRDDYGISDYDITLTNSNYCKMWNNGADLADAGTGVSDGGDECVSWNSAPKSTVSVMTVLLAAILVLLW